MTLEPQSSTSTASVGRPLTRLRSFILEPYILAAIVLAVVGYQTTFGSQYSVFMLNTILLAAFGAIALDLLMGTGGQVSIGNAAFVAAGAFSTVAADRAGVPFPVDIIIAALVCAVVGLIVGLPALRIRGMYLALATLAAVYIVQFIATHYQTETVGAGGFFLDPVFQGTLGEQHYMWAWLLGGVLAATVILASWLRTGRSGRAWRMIRDRELAAAMMGIPVPRFKLMLFVITSAIIGIQGGLMARFTASVSHDTFTLALSIAAIAMILIGGLDSLAGPLIGALIVTLLPTVVPDLLDLFGGVDASDLGGYSQILYGLLIIVFIIGAPNGLNGLIRTIGRLLLKLTPFAKQSQAAPAGQTEAAAEGPGAKILGLRRKRDTEQ